MDPRLLALPHVQGRLERVNVCPRRRAELTRRYGALCQHYGMKPTVNNEVC